MRALNNLLGNIRCGSERFRIALALHMGTVTSVGRAFDIIIENKKEPPPEPFVFGKSHVLTHRNAQFHFKLVFITETRTISYQQSTVDLRHIVSNTGLEGGRMCDGRSRRC